MMYDMYEPHNEPESQKPNRLPTYERLLAKEEAVAKPDDKLRLFLDPHEVEKLQKLGVVIEPVQSEGLQVAFNLFQITRSEFNRFGVAFINRISRDAQKPLLMGQIPLASSRVIELGNEPFLDTQTLELIKQYQEQERQADGIALNFEEIRSEMCHVLDCIFDQIEGKRAKELDHIHLINNTLDEIAAELAAAGDTDGVQKVKEYREQKSLRKLSRYEHDFIFGFVLPLVLEKLGSFDAIGLEELADVIHEQQPRLAEHQGFVNEILADVLSDPDSWEERAKKIPYVSEVRVADILHPERLINSAGIDLHPEVFGVRYQAVGSRYGVLQGLPSPFTASGFVFGENPDITFEFPEGETRRLNMVVLHLWSQGLDEFGGSGDHQYLTAAEAKKLLDRMSQYPADTPITDKQKQTLKEILMRGIFRQLS